MKTKFEVYRSSANKQWYWCANRGKNTVADGGGYNTKAGLLKSLSALLKSIRRCDYTIDEGGVISPRQSGK